MLLYILHKSNDQITNYYTGSKENQWHSLQWNNSSFKHKENYQTFDQCVRICCSEERTDLCLSDGTMRHPVIISCNGYFKRLVQKLFRLIVFTAMPGAMSPVQMQLRDLWLEIVQNRATNPQHVSQCKTGQTLQTCNPYTSRPDFALMFPHACSMCDHFIVIQKQTRNICLKAGERCSIAGQAIH